MWYTTDCGVLIYSFSLQLFNRPALLYRDYASGASPIDGIMRGLYSEPMQTIDRHVTNQVSETSILEDVVALCFFQCLNHSHCSIEAVVMKK